MGYIQDLRKIVGHRTLMMVCACAIIEDSNGNVLLQQRADDSKWGYHGGSVEIDEDVTEALRREVKEELNIDIDEYRFFNIYSGEKSHHIYPNGDECSCIDIVYVISKYHGEMKLQEDEVKEVKWFNKETLPDNLCEGAIRALKDYYK